jgi:hypothetical protein
MLCFCSWTHRFLCSGSVLGTVVLPTYFSAVTTLKLLSCGGRVCKLQPSDRQIYLVSVAPIVNPRHSRSVESNP